MAKIKSVHAREILDSRGNPTVEVDIITDKGLSRASVPSGASTGIHEANELRDGGKRFNGNGVQKAVKNVNTIIARHLNGMDPTHQRNIDAAMLNLDGTENKSYLGANAILAVSMAVCRAGAQAEQIPLYRYIHDLSGSKKLQLPIPSFNIINGGKHAGGKMPIQEFMVLPVGAKSFAHAMQIGSEVYHSLKSHLKKKYGVSSVNVGDEGGFAPPLEHPEEPLHILTDVIDDCGYRNVVKIGMDVASSEFWDGKKYNFEGKKFADQMLHWYERVSKKYPIITIEDPFHQEDFYGFSLATKHLGIQIVGDDLLTTNVKRIQKAIDTKACNALLLKINQIGSISESIDSWKLSTKYKWNVMVSHRSGETEDPFIADLVVGLGTGQLKSGAPCRGERLAKYNQLIRIEEELGKKAVYAKWDR